MCAAAAAATELTASVARPLPFGPTGAGISSVAASSFSPLPTSTARVSATTMPAAATEDGAASNSRPAVVARLSDEDTLERRTVVPLPVFRMLQWHMDWCAEGAATTALWGGSRSLSCGMPPLRPSTEPLPRSSPTLNTPTCAMSRTAARRKASWSSTNSTCRVALSRTSMLWGWAVKLVWLVGLGRYFDWGPATPHPNSPANRFAGTVVVVLPLSAWRERSLRPRFQARPTPSRMFQECRG